MKQIGKYVQSADPGKVVMKLGSFLDNNGYSKSGLSRAANIDYRIIKRLCVNDVQRVDLEIMARICYSLDCDLADILEYQKPKE